jgi:hypothetical protein
MRDSPYQNEGFHLFTIEIRPFIIKPFIFSFRGLWVYACMLSPKGLFYMSQFQNAHFCTISAPAPWNAKPIPLGLCSNFNPRNIQYITAVKIFAFLDLEQN